MCISTYNFGSKVFGTMIYENLQVSVGSSINDVNSKLTIWPLLITMEKGGWGYVLNCLEYPRPHWSIQIWFVSDYYTHSLYHFINSAIVAGVYRRSIFKIRPNILIGLQKLRLRPKDQSRSRLFIYLNFLRGFSWFYPISTNVSLVVEF